MLNSMYGEVASAWKLEGETFTLAVTIPANARATVRLPDASLEKVTESEQPLAGAEGISRAYQDGDVVVVEAGSGQYQFSYTAPELAAQLAAANKLSTNITLKKLFADAAARAVLAKHVPELLDIPPERRQRVMGISLKQLAAYAPTMLTEERLNAIDEALAEL
jgi:alpha-L-rhamnosidase